MKDDLGVCLQKLKNALQESKIPVLDGYLSDEPNLPEVCLDDEPVETASDRFTQAAVSQGAKFVVISSERLTNEELDGAIEDAESDEDSDADLLPLLKRCKACIGHVGYIKALFMLAQPPSVVSIELFASWHEHAYATIGDQETEENNDSSSRPSASQITEYANTLASDPKFQTARNQASRMYVAKKVFAAKLEELEGHLAEIVDEAKSIYEIDIKPQKSGGKE